MSQSKKESVPYSSTHKSPYETKTQIEQMLAKHGITRVAWEFDLEKEIIDLHFEFNGKPYRIKPTIALQKVRAWNKIEGRTKTEFLPNMAATMRALKDYVRLKLIAVENHWFDMEQEFLSQRIVNTKSGPKTLGEIMPMLLESGRLALTDMEVEQNEPSTSGGQAQKVIEAEYEEGA